MSPSVLKMHPMRGPFQQNHHLLLLNCNIIYLGNVLSPLILDNTNIIHISNPIPGHCVKADVSVLVVKIRDDGLLLPPGAGRHRGGGHVARARREHCGGLLGGVHVEQPPLLVIAGLKILPRNIFLKSASLVFLWISLTRHLLLLQILQEWGPRTAANVTCASCWNGLMFDTLFQPDIFYSSTFLITKQFWAASGETLGVAASVMVVKRLSHDDKSGPLI